MYWLLESADCAPQRRSGFASPWPDLCKLQELFAHVAACLSQRRRYKSRAKQIIAPKHGRPIVSLRRTAGRGNKDALKRPDRIADPAAHPLFQAPCVPDDSLLDGCFKTPGMAVTADG